MKACTSTCGAWKSDLAFYPDARNRDGLSGACKDDMPPLAALAGGFALAVKGTMSQARDYDGKFARRAA